MLALLKDTHGSNENFKRLLRIARRTTSGFQHQDTLALASDSSPRLSHTAGSGFQLMLQSSQFDGVVFDPFSF
jgi:hypothetical protein